MSEIFQTAECGCRRCGRFGLLLSSLSFFFLCLSFSFFSRKHKTHVVVCEGRGLHEWKTKTVLRSVNRTTLILPQVLITLQKRKQKKGAPFNFSFR